MKPAPPNSITKNAGPSQTSAETHLQLARDHIASLQQALETALAQRNAGSQTSLREAFENQNAQLKDRVAEQQRALHAAAVELALLKTQLQSDFTLLAAQNRAASVDAAEIQRLQSDLITAQRTATAWQSAAADQSAIAEAALRSAQDLATEADLLRCQLASDVRLLAQHLRSATAAQAGFQAALAEAAQQATAWQDEAERQQIRRTIAEAECETLHTTLAELQADLPPRLRKLLRKNSA